MQASSRPGDLSFLTIHQAETLLRTRRLSPVELTRAVLDRIAQYNPCSHAYITVAADWAMEQARRAEQEIMGGGYRGPLHGIPLGLKDIYDVAGVPTTAGSKVLIENIPLAHATAAAKLLDAGAVIAGKHNLHEFAYGFTNIKPHFGTLPNPWKAGCLAGGSSEGTAVAVATGLCLGGEGVTPGARFACRPRFAASAGSNRPMGASASKVWCP